MKIYDSLSRNHKQVPKNKKLKLFVCGPTVYDDAHIGHARTYLAFDLFARYLKSRGYKIEYVQNITDIDDKIIIRAREEKKKPLILARNFEKRYRENMKRLRITSVNRYARATAFIPEIVKQVKTLIKKGYAYKAADGYYFNIEKFKEYGKLSGRTALQAEDAVSRIDESAEKINKGDFALWKFSEPGEPVWKTELGSGRPGWHIEDTAISEKFFGPQYDIHGGANELKFPHHEAEIAQQEAASGKKPFVKIWMHTGVLTVGNQKMSKSLKNFITIRDFLRRHSPDTLRMMVLQRHYRSPLNYSEAAAHEASQTYNRIINFLAQLKFVSDKQKKWDKTNYRHFRKIWEEKFHGALENDFNTPEAVSMIFVNALEPVQKHLFEPFAISKKDLTEIRKNLTKTLKSLGFSVIIPKIPLKIENLAKKRELYRANKQFSQADALRKNIRTLGYEIEDTPLGPFVTPKNHAESKSKNTAAGS